MLDAAELDAVVREHVRVVLQVMADFRRRALEPRLEPREHALAVQLIRRAGVAVREREVGGLARRDRERDADELGFHVVEAGGLGVERDERRACEPLAPALERRFGEHGLVAAGRRCQAPVQALRAGLRQRLRPVGGGAVAAHAAQQAAEFESLEECREAVLVGRTQREVGGA